MHTKQQSFFDSFIRVLYYSLLLIIFAVSCDGKPEKESYTEKQLRIDERIKSISNSLQIPILNDSTFVYTIDYQLNLPGKNFITEFRIDDIFLLDDKTYIYGNLFLDNSSADLYFRFVVKADILPEIYSQDSKRVIAHVYIERVERITFSLKTDQLDEYSSTEIEIDWLTNPILLEGSCLRIFDL